jgi:cytochrome c553
MHMTRATFRSASIPVVVLILFAAGVAAAGGPVTPLGKWMKPNMGAPMAGQDFATLQSSLTLVAGKPPSADYPQWAAFAQAGAAAAAKEDKAGVKASCTHCHDAYKQKYIKEFPTRPFP